MDPINIVDAEVDKENLEIGGDESQTVEPINKKAKSTTSDYWKFFTVIGPGKDGINRARCNACNTDYKVGGKQYGTSSLNRHISRCKQIKSEDIGQLMVDMQGKLKPRKIDQLVSREMCAQAIIEHDLPFKFVEYKKVRNWINYLNADAIPITRNTAKGDVLKIYKREKEKLKQEMSSIPTRISLTTDLWTSCTTEGYICLTAHFVDTNWKLNSKIINFCHMPPPHTGSELSKKIFEFLSDWGIEKKIFSLTVDNASSNNVMQQLLKGVLQNWLFCDGEFFHVRCSAHILNLIVQEGLKVADDALRKIRESVKYVRGSEGRMKKFKECIERIGGVDTSVRLCLDVPTRWNSTYLMLDRALKYKRVFCSLHFDDDSHKYCPLEEEWKRTEKICVFLLPFYQTTNMISGTSYPTSNLYFLQVWKIQCILIESLKDEDQVIRNMADMMMSKFQSYWDDYSIVLALGAVLDPRLKLSSLSYCYSTVDESTCEDKLGKVKSKLYMLFEKYSTFKDRSATIHTPSSTSSMKKDSNLFCDNLFNGLKMHNQQLASKPGKSQLDVYLDEPSMDFTYYEGLDVLQWWKDNNSRFSELSIMARDLLSIPITTVASESAFSIGSIVINKYRNRLLSKNVEALICTRNWIHGFVSDDNDIDDEDDRDRQVEPSTSKTASNVLILDDDN